MSDKAYRFISRSTTACGAAIVAGSRLGVAVDHGAGAGDQRLERGDGLLARAAARSAPADRSAWPLRVASSTAVMVPASMSRQSRTVGSGGIVGGDRHLPVLETRGDEMLAVAHRLPVEKIGEAVGAARQHFQQHDRFVEMVEIVGGEPGRRIDIGVGEPHGARRPRRPTSPRPLATPRRNPDISSIPAAQSHRRRSVMSVTRLRCPIEGHVRPLHAHFGAGSDPGAVSLCGAAEFPAALQHRADAAHRHRAPGGRQAAVRAGALGPVAVVGEGPQDLLAADQRARRIGRSRSRPSAPP